MVSNESGWGKGHFVLALEKHAIQGIPMRSTETYKWDQNTGGERHGYYAKIIRWYVNDKKRSKKAFIMSQALMWSVSEDRTSETQLKDVIKQVKSNTGYWNDKTVDSLYDSIFKPSGSWIAEATYWKKSRAVINPIRHLLQ